MSAHDGPDVVLRLPPLDGATAAWILDLCGLLQTAIWRAYGDEIEAHWTATEPDQPIYGRLASPPTRKRRRR
jgi:hypothetical protein